MWASLTQPCRDSKRAGSALLAFILDQDCRVYSVALQSDIADFLLQPDSHLLFAFAGLPRITDNVVLENQAAGLASDANACRSVLHAVVLNEILFQTISVTRHALALFPEIHPILVIAADLIVPQQVVRILVANGNAEATIAFQAIVLKYTVLYPPAQKQPVLAVPAGGASAYGRALRSTAGMNAQRYIFLAQAVHHRHVITLLEADAIARVTAHSAALHDSPRTAIEKDATAPASV